MSRESSVVGNIRRLREHGEAIVLADQCISSIKDVVKSNVYTTIGMSQIGQKDRREMISVLGLDATQAQAVNFLDVGQAIIRLGGRYPYPQLIVFPLVTPLNISETELDRLNETDPKVKDLLNDVRPAGNSSDSWVEQIKGIPAYTMEDSTEKKPDKMLEKSLGILLDIFNRFDVPSTQRAKDFGLSASAADKIFKYIEREQLADPIRLNVTGGRGKTAKYYEPTKKGHKPINRTPPKKPGGTGPTHFFIQRYLKKHLAAKGFSNLEIEKNIGGKCIDLFGIFRELKIGIEICCTTIKTEHINVRKNQGKCDILIIATPDKKTKVKLEKELYRKVKPHKTLKTCVVYELLNHPEKIIKN